MTTLSLDNPAAQKLLLTEAGKVAIEHLRMSLDLPCKTVDVTAPIASWELREIRVSLLHYDKLNIALDALCKDIKTRAVRTFFRIPLVPDLHVLRARAEGHGICLTLGIEQQTLVISYGGSTACL